MVVVMVSAAFRTAVDASFILHASILGSCCLMERKWKWIPFACRMNVYEWMNGNEMRSEGNNEKVDKITDQQIEYLSHRLDFPEKES